MAASTDFVEREDLEFADQLQDFADGLDTYGSALGFSGAEITAAHDDATFVGFVMGKQSNYQNLAKEFTAFKNLARNGSDNQTMPTTYPAPVAMPVSPPAIQPGKAKAHKDYTVSIGQTLHIEAAQEVFDPQQGKPVFKVALNGGHPELKWTKGKFQGVEIHVNRGTGWAALNRDFTSPYVDTFTLSAGQSATWKYKLFYLFNDERVGQPSDEVSITVNGDDMQ